MGKDRGWYANDIFLQGKLEYCFPIISQQLGKTNTAPSGLFLQGFGIPFPLLGNKMAAPDNSHCRTLYFCE